MKLNKEKQGEASVLSSAALWGIFPVIIVLSYNTLSPLSSLGISSIFAAVFFAGVITFKKGWPQVFKKAAIKYILLATLILGIIYYLLYFFGLRFTTPGNASIVGLTEIFFSYMFFHVLKKERLPKEHIFGAILMIIGALIILYPSFAQFRYGDLLILGANIIAPLGNYYAIKARSIVTSETIMFIRSVISGVFVLMLAYSFSSLPSFSDLKDSFLFLIISGVLILGFSKSLWIEGIHRIPVTKANALASTAPLVTLLFAWLILKTPPASYQILSFIPIFIGVVLLSTNKTGVKTNI